MDFWNTLLNSVTLVTVVGGFGLFILRTVTKSGIEKATETAVSAAFDKYQWPVVLARELEKTRGIERQALRFKSYGALCNALRPLAIYDDNSFSNEEAQKMNTDLSDWYFSESGGLLLTPQARNFFLRSKTY